MPRPIGSPPLRPLPLALSSRLAAALLPRLVLLLSTGLPTAFPSRSQAAPTSPALTGITITAGKYNVVCFFIDSASTVTAAAGTEGATLAAVKFPVPCWQMPGWLPRDHLRIDLHGRHHSAGHGNHRVRVACRRRRPQRSLVCIRSHHHGKTTRLSPPWVTRDRPMRPKSRLAASRSMERPSLPRTTWCSKWKLHAALLRLRQRDRPHQGRVGTRA